MSDPMSISRKHEQEENSDYEEGETEQKEKQPDAEDANAEKEDAATRQAAKRAPPSYFVSSWPLDQLEATQRILFQVHNTLQKLQPKLKVILMRIQDRLAHYLISCAYHGESSEWSREAGFTWSAESVMTGSSQKNENVTRSRLEKIRFPSPIESAMSELLEMCRRVVAKGLDSALGIEGSKKWKEPTILQPKHYEGIDDDSPRPRVNTKDDSTVFSKNCVNRWISDFKCGLNKQQSNMTDASTTNSSSSSSSSSSITPSDELLADPLFSVYLRLFVGFFTSEILDVSSHTIQWGYHSTSLMNTVNLWRACHMDTDEFRVLIDFLGIDWRVTAEIGPIMVNPHRRYEPSDHQMQLWKMVKDDTGDSGPHKQFPTLVQVLPTEFTKEPIDKTTPDQLDELIDITVSSSISNSSSSSISTLIETSASLSLRCYNNMRAYRYWGTHVSLFNANTSLAKPMAEERQHGDIDGDCISFPDDFEDYFYEYSSFTIEDVSGREWHFMLEFQEDAYYIIELDRGETIASFRKDEKKRMWCFTFESIPVQYARDGSKIQYQPHTLEQLRENAAPASRARDAPATSVSASSSSSSSAPLFDPLSNFFVDGCPKVYLNGPERATPPAEATLLTIDQPMPNISHVQQELAFILVRSLYLCQTDLDRKRDAIIYTGMQSRSARKQFTARLIDAGMIASQLEPMPQVLSQLIAEYAPLHLPCADLY